MILLPGRAKSRRRSLVRTARDRSMKFMHKEEEEVGRLSCCQTMKPEVKTICQMQNQDQEDSESEDLTTVVPVHFRGSSAPNRLKGSGDPISGLEDAAAGDLTMVVPVHFRGSSAPNRLKGSGDPIAGSGAGQSHQDQDENQEKVMELSGGEM